MDTKILTPEWLKYGIIGLVAIFAIIVYLLLRKQINLAKGKHLYFLLSSLIATFLLFLCIATYSVFSENKLKYSNKSTVDSLNNVVSNLIAKIDLYKGNNPESDSLVYIIKNNRKLLDSLTKLNNYLSDTISEKELLLTRIISDKICNAISNDYYSTSGKIGLVMLNGEVSSTKNYSNTKILSATDLSFRRLRLAIFNNISIVNADINILKMALPLIQKRNLTISDKNIKDIILSFPDLLRVRLDWIEHKALLAGTNALERKAVDPSQITPLSFFVQYPKKVWIVDNDSLNSQNGVYIDIRDKADLENEKNIILKKL